MLEVGDKIELAYICQGADAEDTCYHNFSFLTPFLSYHLSYKYVGQVVRHRYACKLEKKSDNSNPERIDQDNN